MEKKKIFGYLIDVEHNCAAPVKINKSLEGYYSVLNCDCIDITSRSINGKRYEIVCDDEALLKGNPKISAVSCDGNPMLCGNLFIVKFDGVDDLTDLDADDVVFIDSCVRLIVTGNSLVPYPVLGECGY